jgi:hypothetical protein
MCSFVLKHLLFKKVRCVVHERQRNLIFLKIGNFKKKDVSY